MIRASSLLLAAALVSSGCTVISGVDDLTVAEPPGQGGGTGTGGSSATGGGGSGGGSSGGGSGGTGAAASHAPAATETVSGGTVSENTNYWLVLTVGQPSMHQTKTETPNYRLHGGFVRATGDPQ